MPRKLTTQRLRVPHGTIPTQGESWNATSPLARIVAIATIPEIDAMATFATQTIDRTTRALQTMKDTGKRKMAEQTLAKQTRLLDKLMRAKSILLARGLTAQNGLATTNAAGLSGKGDRDDR